MLLEASPIKIEGVERRCCQAFFRGSLPRLQEGIFTDQKHQTETIDLRHDKELEGTATDQETKRNEGIADIEEIDGLGTRASGKPLKRGLSGNLLLMCKNITGLIGRRHADNGSPRIGTTIYF